MRFARTHKGCSAFTGPSTTRSLRPFPPTVAIPTADLARHPPPTATHHEPPKKLVQARTPDQTQRRVPRNALARSARRSQRNGTERGVGRPRFPSTRRPTVSLSSKPRKPSRTLLPFPHSTPFPPLGPQHFSGAVPYLRDLHAWSIEQPGSLRIRRKSKGQTRSCGWPPPPLLLRRLRLQISACGDGVVLGGSPRQPQGGREDLQDQVRAVPHGREGRRSQAR